MDMHRLAVGVARITFVGACLTLGGCFVASGTEAAVDGAPAGPVGSAAEASVARPPWLTYYYWNSARDAGVTKTMISDQEGFCALTNIGGRFRTTADFVGVWQSGGHFTLSGTTNQTGAAVQAGATCVPISQFSSNGWAYSGVFFSGWTSTGTNSGGSSMDLTGWDSHDSRCWVNGLGGDFSRGGEVMISYGNGPDWHLNLGGVGYKGQQVVGRASCVKFASSSALASSITKVWTNRDGTGALNRTVKLAPASTHFCFLSGVGMGTTETTDSVYITYLGDGFYYLTGNWSGGNAAIWGKATCIAYDQR